MGKFSDVAWNLLGALAASVLLIVVGIVYFVVVLFVLRIAAALAFPGAALDVNWAVLATALLTAASLIGAKR